MVFGTGKSNYEQYQEFKERYYKGEFDVLLDEELKSYNSIKRLEVLKQVV
jgi:hypothetical protein